LPFVDAALITNFSMTIDNASYYSRLVNTAEAQTLYDAAKGEQ
jgi:hypothetical protein